jgi:hypothetical protein
VALVAVTAMVYAPCLWHEFALDDATYFTQNDLLIQTRPWYPAAFLAPTNYWGELLPLRDWFYSFQYQLFGMNPVGYRATSLAIYLATCFAAFGLMRELLRKERPGVDGQAPVFAVVISTALFSLHPMHAEVAATIFGQKDLLFAFFSLTAIRFALRAFHRRSEPIRTGLSCLAMTYAAAFSKLVAAVNVLTVPILWATQRNANPRRFLRFLVAWVLANIPLIVWVHYSSGLFKDNSSLMDPVPLGERLILGIRVLGAHTTLVLWPSELSFGYPFVRQFDLDAPFWAGLLVLAVFTVALSARPRSTYFLGAAWYLLYFLPILQLFRNVPNAVVYDRYAFLPIFGIALIVGAILRDTRTRAPSVRLPLDAATIAIVLVVAWQTWVYIPKLSSDEAAAENSHRLFPEWSRAAFDYATALVDSDKLDEAERFIDREPTLADPAWVRDYFNGRVALGRGEASDAITLLDRASRIARMGGYYPFADLDLAEAYIGVGRRELALAAVDRVLMCPIQNPIGTHRARVLHRRLMDQ